MLLDASMLHESSQALGTSAVICMLKMLYCCLQVLAGLRYAEAYGPSLQQSPFQLATKLLATSSGQGHSPSVYSSSPKASAILVHMSRAEPGQGRSPSVQSSLPQGLPFGGTVQGSSSVLDRAASLPFSPAAAPQLTHEHAPAALGAAPQRDRNASFGESSTAVGQQLNPDLLRQYDDKPLSNGCAHPLSDQSLKNTSGAVSAVVSKVSKKRAAEVSFAEPKSKQLTLAEGVNVLARRRSSGGQGTSAVGGAPGHVGEAAADVDGDGDSMMADGKPDGKGRRRLVRLWKKSITTAVDYQVYHGDEDVQAVASC